MAAGNDVPGTFTTFATYVRRAVGRPPVCRLDATFGGYCRLVTFDGQGNEETIFTVPVAQIEHVALRVGTLMIRVGGRTHQVQLASPNAAATLGMKAMGLSALGGAGGGGAAPAGALAGSAVAGFGMARREKQVDSEGLQWLRLFADHGVEVEAPQRWKPRVRYILVGIAVLITAIGVLGSAAGVAEEGGWTAEARNGVVGMAVFVGLTWAICWMVARWLRKTVRRDTARRVGAVPSRSVG